MPLHTGQEIREKQIFFNVHMIMVHVYVWCGEISSPSCHKIEMFFNTVFNIGIKSNFNTIVD